jgi:hypothetical protein
MRHRHADGARPKRRSRSRQNGRPAQVLKKAKRAGSLLCALFSSAMSRNISGLRRKNRAGDFRSLPTP